VDQEHQVQVAVVVAVLHLIQREEQAVPD
jgi:hypothetical protein